MRFTTTIKKRLLQASLFFICWIVSAGILSAQDLVVLGGFYDQALYPGYQAPGIYQIQLSKTSSYTFTDTQFELNITLPAEGPYDPTRAAAVVLPAGWVLVVNSNTSLTLYMSAGTTFSGSGPGVNRRRDFFIPIITTAAASNISTNVSVNWKDPNVTESPNGNTGGSVLNVLDVNLPVTLVSFSASGESTVAQLSWATTEEINADRFDIQRSADAKTWNTIGSKTAKGESKALVNYSFADVSPLGGINYYRLKMIDRDATYAYSTIRSVEFAGGKMLSIYPNPVSNVLFLQDAAGAPVDVKNVKEVSIVNASGITAYKSTSVSATGINVSGLSSGIYVVRVTKTDGAISSHKIVITK